MHHHNSCVLRRWMNGKMIFKRTSGFLHMAYINALTEDCVALMLVHGALGESKLGG